MIHVNLRSLFMVGGCPTPTWCESKTDLVVRNLARGTAALEQRAVNTLRLRVYLVRSYRVQCRGMALRA